MVKAIVFDMDGTLYIPSPKYDKKGIIVPADKEDFFKRAKVLRGELNFLKRLKKRYALYLVTTGVKSWQEQKIERFT
ncbi:MAG: hypothetical protein HY515_01870, partial [Candidatus Aenigmarchaeota archaeon]|nr:hypothetical protein [Candidatus Aenigmarchaeota archaeon]